MPERPDLALLDELFACVHDILLALRPGYVKKDSTNRRHFNVRLGRPEKIDVELRQKGPRPLVSS